jgi:hypothetical protein
MEHVNPHAVRKPRAEVFRQPELVAGPAVLADERGGAQHDRLKHTLRRLLGERIDEDCRAHRMASHDGAVVQVRHLTSDRRAPLSVTRVLFVAHTGVADLVPVSELSAQAFNQLVVPFVMRARAATLDEQDLASPSSWRSSFIMAILLRALERLHLNTHSWPVSTQVGRRARQGLRRLRREHPQLARDPPLAR